MTWKAKVYKFPWTAVWFPCITFEEWCVWTQERIKCFPLFASMGSITGHYVRNYLKSLKHLQYSTQNDPRMELYSFKHLIMIIFYYLHFSSWDYFLFLSTWYLLKVIIPTENSGRLKLNVWIKYFVSKHASTALLLFLFFSAYWLQKDWLLSCHDFKMPR